MKTSSWLMMALALSLSGAEGVAAESEKEAQDVVGLFMKTDPGLKQFFGNCVGYAVFPAVTKAAVGIGGAQGGGYVYDKNALIGTVTLTQMTLGWSLGAQSYAELIFFETNDAFNQFKKNETVLSAQIGAVAAAEGASAKAKYQIGVAVFTITKNGLMFEASVGGQKFSFVPVAR